MSDTAGAARVWAGVDLGGTATRLVVADEAGTEVAGATVGSDTFSADPVGELADLLSGLVPMGARLEGLGVGASGPVDLRSGEIRNPDTLPRFTGLDVAGGLERRLAAPAWIDNDAVVAALGEAEWGAGAGEPSVLCVTLGTGIGAALVADGHPVRAADGQHPEAGHIPVAGDGSPCYCGLPQCWEQVASRTSLDRLRGSGLVGDPLWAEYGRRVASGLVALLTVYHPRCVVVCGSVAAHWRDLEPALRAALAPYREFSDALVVRSSALGDRAGALGATLLPRRSIGWRSGPR